MKVFVVINPVKIKTFDQHHKMFDYNKAINQLAYK